MSIVNRIGDLDLDENGTRSELRSSLSITVPVISYSVLYLVSIIWFDLDPSEPGEPGDRKMAQKMSD